MISRTIRQLYKNNNSIPITKLSKVHLPTSGSGIKQFQFQLQRNKLHYKPSNDQSSSIIYNSFGKRFVQTVALPFTSSISPPPINSDIETETQNISKSDRIMARVWQKRKDRLQKATSAILDKFVTNDSNIDSVCIYIRGAGSFDDNEDNGQREVHIALRGIAHTVVVLKLKNSSSCYLLDRVVEGIRLSELKLNTDINGCELIEKCNKFKPNEMIKLKTISGDKINNLTTKQVANWINEQSKTQYHVIKNSCVHFSFYFYQNFLINNIFKWK